jgi:hypothetical protein
VRSHSRLCRNEQATDRNRYSRKPFARREPFVTSPKDAHTLFEYLIEGGSDERLFRFEMRVETAVRQPGLSHDRRDAKPMRTVAAKRTRRQSQQLLACLVLMVSRISHQIANIEFRIRFRAVNPA